MLWRTMISVWRIQLEDRLLPVFYWLKAYGWQRLFLILLALHSCKYMAWAIQDEQFYKLYWAISRIILASKNSFCLMKWSFMALTGTPALYHFTDRSSGYSCLWRLTSKFPIASLQFFEASDIQHNRWTKFKFKY